MHVAVIHTFFHDLASYDIQTFQGLLTLIMCHRKYGRTTMTINFCIAVYVGFHQ